VSNRLGALRLGLAVVVVAVVATACSLVATACSFTRFGYNQADTLAAWMADEYFDLDGQQKQEFANRFGRFYAWHRNEQLPDYAAFMRTAQGKVKQGIAREDVLWFVDGLRTRVRTAARQGAPEAAAFLATLTPAQIENLKKKWEKDNKKYVKENKVNGTADERAEVEAKKVVKTFKEWLTPLTSEQEARVAAMVRDLPAIDQFRYTERLRRQKDFIALLQHRTEDRERFTQRVGDYLANWDRGRTAEEQKRLDAWWHKRADIFVSLDKTLSADQRTASIAKMGGYIDDFTQLAGKGTPRTAAR
jgi:hypothetical protein